MGKQHDALFAAKLAGSSGGGGTSDYTDLANKPKINGTTLTGDKSSTNLGLQAEITVNNKLPSDLVDDTNATNLFVTSAEKNTWNGKQNALSFDSVPTYGSTNPVESNGICDALAGKVDKVSGKGLSTNDFTDAYRTKLAVIDPDIDDVPKSGSTHPVSSGGVYDALGNKVNKVSGKGLSTEDFTAMYKAWLDVSMQSPLNHNGIFRGKDLTDVYTVNEMYSMINAGTFDDLFLGDCFTKSITTDIMTRFTDAEFESDVTYYEVGGADPVSRTFTETGDTEPQSGKIYCTKLTKTEFVTLMFSAFDYYYNMGDTSLTTHHAVLIPRIYGFETAAKMNPTNTTVGGYYNSDMHQIVLPCYAKSLKTTLNNHLLSHRTLLSNAINESTPSMAGAGITGASSGWTWAATELQLMTEMQLYGSMVWSSSAYDVGTDCKKLPIFGFINPVQYGRTNFWLRSAVSSTNFAICGNGGNAGNNGASSANSVRPLIVFG